MSVPDLAEFGIGRLLRRDEAGRPVLHFSSEGKKILAPQHRLVRALLGTGTEVRCTLPGTDAILPGIILESAEFEAGSLAVYRVRVCGQEHLISENDVLPVAGEHDPLQLLKALKWDPCDHFASRWAMADLLSRWFMAADGFPALIGARIRPLGHQLYAARRVLLDPRPRFILADEVGLGKTIEAGLVIQALQAEKPELSVLVLAPGSMSRQWLSELYLRFGARAYTHIDANRLSEASARETMALVGASHLIVATTALEVEPQLGTALASRHWDLVVVDEAHQYPPGSPHYPLLQSLAAAGEGLLLLSATPSKRDIGGLAGLLALVAPEAWSTTDVEKLHDRVALQADIWDRLNATSRLIESTAAEGRALDEEELEFLGEEWEGLLEGDPVVAGIVERMTNGEAAAASELVAYVQEFHRLDHRIIRTRRATLSHPDMEWPERALETIAYELSPEEGMLLDHLAELPSAADEAGTALRCLYHRFCCSTPASAGRFLEARKRVLEEASPAYPMSDPLDALVSDPGPADEGLVLTALIESVPPLPGEMAWLEVALPLTWDWRDQTAGGGRLEAVSEWVQEHLNDHLDHQVLLFTQDHRAAEEVAAHLKSVIGENEVAAFHYGLPEDELATVAFRFQHDRRCRVLVSDELGGEGRNFQNASALVHFDLPLSPARLEQRIGRLDRIGRGAEQPVLSVAVEGAAAVERELLALHREVFRVFNRTIGGLEFALPRLQRRVVEAYGSGPGAVTDAASGLAAEVQATLDATDEAFELSMDATRPQLDAAIALAGALEESVPVEEVASTVRGWAKRLGIKVKETEPGTWDVKWSNADLRVPIPALTVGDGRPDLQRFFRGTFDREAALAHENLQYLAPGHDLIDALNDQIQHGRHGRVTAYILQQRKRYGNVILLQVLGRSVLDESLWPMTGIGPGLAARARAALWPQVLPELVMVWNGQTPCCALVNNASLRSILGRPPNELPLKPINPGDMMQLPFIGDVWQAVDQAVPQALEAIRERRRPFAEERAVQLADSLRNEIGFLSWQLTSGGGAAVQQAIDARHKLIDSVREARVEALSLALIVLP